MGQIESLTVPVAVKERHGPIGRFPTGARVHRRERVESERRVIEVGPSRTIEVAAARCFE